MRVLLLEKFQEENEDKDNFFGPSTISIYLIGWQFPSLQMNFVIRGSPDRFCVLVKFEFNGFNTKGPHEYNATLQQALRACARHT